MASNPMNDWSYSGSPSTSKIDAIRFLIGDTDPRDKKVTNSEIKFVANSFGDVYTSGAIVAESLAAKYASEADYQVGDVSEKASQKAIAMREVAKRLRALTYTLGSVMPAFGTGSDKLPIFTNSQFDNNKGAQLNGRDPGITDYDEEPSIQ
jgi:hypothetical protein